MKPQTLAKLDLMAAAQEAALLEKLALHSQTLQRYEAQCEILASYQERLAAGWRGGGVMRAGDAKRAGQFSSQAGQARAQLTQAMAAERDQLTECSAALAQLRARRRALAEQIATALRQETAKAQERAAQNRTAPHRPQHEPFA